MMSTTSGLVRREVVGGMRSTGTRFQGKTAASTVEPRSRQPVGTERRNPSFACAHVGSFFQSQPRLGNQFLEDVTLQRYMRRHLPVEMYAPVSVDLEQFGSRVTSDLLDLHAEINQNPPRLENYDAWGRRVDRIITCQAWKEMKHISAEEGLIAIGYDSRYEHWSRLYQFSKVYLFSPSGGFFTCPLAMTDGAAKSLQLINRSQGESGPLADAFQRLTSRDPKQFWTSGQWMTERRGGSDVAGGTETRAVRQSNGTYRLYGYKWFSSATEAEMALTLARPCENFSEGTKGLAMFFLHMRDTATGDLNGIEVQRLKDKLGTRQVPTAELLLDGARAIKVSDDGRGVASITTMLALTRIHNAVISAATMRRIVNLARDYATKRECFGRTIKDHALHIKTLAKLEVETRAAFLLTFDMVRLLGLDDYRKSTPAESDVFRLIVPVTKMYTAKQAVAVASEGLECFGGMGYLEDTGLPQILRDAQVLPIWEGTTNILSLDVLRALSKSGGTILNSFRTEVMRRLKPAQQIPELRESASKVELAVQKILLFVADHPDRLEIAAREFAYSLARIYMGLLMLEHASYDDAGPDDVLAANIWCQQDLTPVLRQQEQGNYHTGQASSELNLVYAGWSPVSAL